MKALILAAGRGTRLGEYTANNPKTLIDIGGKTLLRRSMENLRDAGFEQVSLVLGYRHEMIEAHLAEFFPKDFYRVVLNPDYTRGSGSSLICASREIEGDLLIVESDLLYDKRILMRMANPDLQNAMAMGHFNHGRREVKIYLKNDNYIEHAAWSDPDDTNAAGDWVGFTRLNAKTAADLKNMLESTNPDQGQEIHYEFFIFQLLSRYPFQAVYIQDIPWIEIDNAIDLQRARTEVCPKIDKPAIGVAL